MDTATVAGVASLMNSSVTQQALSASMIKQNADVQGMVAEMIAQNAQQAATVTQDSGYGFSTYA